MAATVDAQPGLAPNRFMAEASVLRRVRPSLLIAFGVLFCGLLLTDTGGFLSTDVGGKIATLEAMADRGDLRPDLGYWAESADPDGSLYPMWSTVQLDDQWVNVTSLPMLYVALPLYVVGGALLAGLVPIVGTLGAALGVRHLSRRLGTGDGMVAFWVVALASPATIYALDFWEHSWGLALMVWGVALALSAGDGAGSWRHAAVAGLLFGLAATMRQEALVYGAVSGAGIGLRLLAGRRLLTALGRGGAMLMGTAVALGANLALEVVVLGGSFRGGRNTSTVGGAGSDLGARIEEAVITGASPFARADPANLMLAGMVVVLLVAVGLRADRPVESQRLLYIGLGMIGLVMALDVVSGGLGFVPGLAVTTPLAVVGLSRGWATAERRFVAAVAVVSLPLVWATQYTGGAGPQWGGRYILTTGALGIVLAVSGLTSDRGRATLRTVATMGAAVTLIGVAWTVHRTHSFANAMTELADRGEPTLVFHDPFMAREAGALILDEQWLAAPGPDLRAEAVEVLEQLGIEEVGFVDRMDGSERRVLPGWVAVDEEAIGLLDGLELRLTVWRAPG